MMEWFERTLDSMRLKLAAGEVIRKAGSTGWREQEPSITLNITRADAALLVLLSTVETGGQLRKILDLSAEHRKDFYVRLAKTIEGQNA